MLSEEDRSTSASTNKPSVPKIWRLQAAVSDTSNGESVSMYISTTLAAAACNCKHKQIRRHEREHSMSTEEPRLCLCPLRLRDDRPCPRTKTNCKQGHATSRLITTQTTSCQAEQTAHVFLAVLARAEGNERGQ